MAEVFPALQKAHTERQWQYIRDSKNSSAGLEMVGIRKYIFILVLCVISTEQAF